MKRSTLIVSLTGTCLLFCAGSACLGWFFGVRSDAVSRGDAIGIALAQTGPSDVRFARLLRVDGKAVWGAEITCTGQPWVTEVRIHAMTGEVLAVQRESVKKADEELSELAQKLGITAVHLVPKVKRQKNSAPENQPSLNTEASQRN